MDTKLMLIDGHSMAFRAFHALPANKFATSSGQHTNAVYGFTAMLINLIRDESPTHICVAFDTGRVTFRTAEYSEYKDGRKPTPKEFKGQIELIQKVLEALKIVHVEKDQYEADDIIATLASAADRRGWHSVIVSGDRDSYQLVTANTTVLYPKKGVSVLNRMTPQAIEEKYKVSPQRYPELAALAGEKADHLPGVPGIAEKTAAKLLNAYDGLENLLNQADSVKGKAGEALREHIDNVKRNRKLNRLVDDLDLGVEVEDLARASWDAEEVHALFDSLQFRTLRIRLFETLPSQQQQSQTQTIEVDGKHLQPGELANWLGTSKLGFASTTQINAGIIDFERLAFCDQDANAVWADFDELNEIDLAAFADWLANPEAKKVIHGAKPAMKAALGHGWRFEGVVCDTELAAYLAHPAQRSYELADLAIRYLNKELASNQSGDELQETLDFGDDSGQAGKELMVQAGAVIELAEKLLQQLSQMEQLSMLEDLELPIQQMLAEMEFCGIAVDKDLLLNLRTDYDSQVKDAQAKAFEVIGHSLNLGSPKQLQGVLFDELELPPTRKIKSGYTTDAEAIQWLYEQTKHPFLQHLLAYRDEIKLRQTVDGLMKAVRSDGRVHTTFQQTLTATGRLSSVDPNLQNIPVRTQAGVRIRDAFVYGEGFQGLISADYSQIEMRVMAHISDDQELIDAFNTGVDFHTVTASKVYKIPAEQVDSQMRSKVKQMNYGLAYGLSAFGLSSRLGMSVEEATELMDDYFKTFAQVRDCLKNIVAQARINGYTETIMGRRRYLPDLNSENYQLRQIAERAALNAPIQGSAAEIIKIAMLKVDRALKQAKMNSRVLLQVHDELIVEVAPGEEQELKELLRTQMSGAVQLKVPLDVSIGYGASWHGAAH